MMEGKEMLVNAFKDKVFPLNPEESFPEYEHRDEDEDEDENKDRFCTPKEVKTRGGIADFGIREMFEDEEKTPKDMPDLETEEFARTRINQRGKGLKILTPQQMLSRLPISLAHLNAGNNSQKLKNEIR